VEWSHEKQKRQSGSGKKESKETTKKPMSNPEQQPAHNPVDNEASPNCIKATVVGNRALASYGKEQEGHHQDKRPFNQQKNESKLEQQGHSIQDVPSLPIKSTSNNIQINKDNEPKKNQTDGTAYKEDNTDDNNNEDDKQVLNEETIMKKDPRWLKAKTLLQAYIKLKRIYMKSIHEKEEITLENKVLKKRIEQMDLLQTKTHSNLESDQATCQPKSPLSSSSSSEKTKETACHGTMKLFEQMGLANLQNNDAKLV